MNIKHVIIFDNKYSRNIETCNVAVLFFKITNTHVYKQLWKCSSCTIVAVVNINM